MTIGYTLYIILDNLAGDKAFERREERRMKKIRQEGRTELWKDRE